MSQRFSVLMTVYKSDNPSYFEIALNSVLAQTVKPDEVVLVKDGYVPSQIQNVIDKIDLLYPGIIVQVQLKKNKGLGLALNEGLKVCKNELIARMDSDDICASRRFEKQLAMFEQNPKLDIVGCPVKEFVGTPDNIVGKRDVPLDNDEIHKFARRRDPFNHPTVMYRRSKVMKYGPYRDYRKNQDTALWIDLLSNGCVGANVPEYLLMFRFDDGTYKKRKSWINTKLLIKIRWNGYKIGFNSLGDFLLIAIMQIGVYIMPEKFQRFVYTKMLRS